MAFLLQILILSVSLIVNSHGSPWSDNNIYNENDLEWQCKQICVTNMGKSEYNSTNSTCFCHIDNLQDSEIDWKLLKQNAKCLGLFLEILDSKVKKIVKRGIEKLTAPKIVNKNNTEKDKNKETEVNVAPEDVPATTESILGLPLPNRLKLKPLRPRMPPQPVPKLRPILPRHKFLLGNPQKKGETFRDNAINENRANGESETVVSVITRIRERINNMRSAAATARNERVTRPSVINIVAPGNNLIVQPKQTLK